MGIELGDIVEIESITRGVFYYKVTRIDNRVCHKTGVRYTRYRVENSDEITFIDRTMVSNIYKLYKENEE